jgi:RTX calcium-binding nonapeptide repeat (4 copies)
VTSGALLWTFATVAGALLAIFPGSAQAATVGREGPPAFVGFEESTTLFFVAQAGEVNDVAVSPAGASEYRFEDRGAPLTAGAGCRQTTDSHVVMCLRPARGDGFFAFLEDQNDAIRHTVRDGTAFGGSGDDTLAGSRFGDRFEGGSGNDVVVGGAGPDGLDGDGGDDEMSGGPGHDALAGGPGSDRLSGGSGNDSFFPNDFLRFATGGGPPSGQVGNSDSVRGGPGLDLTVYRFEERPGAPTLRVTLNGRPDDGPRGDSDSFGRDVERAYSFASGERCEPRPRGCSVGTFAISDTPGPNGERFAPIGSFSLRIYRLSRRGATRAQAALFETLDAGKVGVSEGRSRTSPSQVSLPKGRLPGCSRRATSSVSRKTVRRLRGRARGRFVTRGRNSAATVRGTDWAIAERCDGTLTTVKRGRVVVRDFRARRTIVLRAGESYLARAPR